MNTNDNKITSQTNENKVKKGIYLPNIRGHLSFPKRHRYMLIRSNVIGDFVIISFINNIRYQKHKI